MASGCTAGWCRRSSRAPAPPSSSSTATPGIAGSAATLAAALRERGYGVLLFDYRGYGGNPGTPTEDGLAVDARAARSFVLARPEAAGTRLVYFGESLGSGVATRLAAEHRPAALVLRSPFTSMADVGAFHYPLLPVRWLLSDRFDTASRIAGLGCPAAGGRRRPGHRRPLCAEPARLRRGGRAETNSSRSRGADHNDPALADGPDLIEAIDRFLKTTAGAERRLTRAVAR